MAGRAPRSARHVPDAPQPGPTDIWHKLSGVLVRRLSAGLLVLLTAGTAVAGAATDRTIQSTRTFRQKAQSTRTFRVAYPDALKYGGSRYSGRVRILPPRARASGSKPSLRKVHILSQGSCQGGSEFCARVRNTNPTGTAAVRVRVIARTELPPGKHR